jgi:hypothetical protein
MAKPAPYIHPAPPVLPSIGENQGLESYLRNFALWAKNGLSDKVSAKTAVPGILLQAYDAPAGTVPAVFMLQVSTAGAVVLTPVPLGSNP